MGACCTLIAVDLKYTVVKQLIEAADAGANEACTGVLG